MPLAQMCGQGYGFEAFPEYIRNWQFVKAFTCQYANVTGFTVLGLVVWGAVSSYTFVRTGSFLLPFGLLLMIGGAALSQMASVALPIAVILILVVPSAATAYLYLRYST